MATRLKPVDAVTIGVGLTGSMAGLELTGAGLTVVGLERGAPRDTVPDFQSPSIHDELRFSIRKAMMQDNVKVAVTFRNTSDQTALPIRRWESFLPGQGLGGSFVHWNGQSFRAQAADFIYRTHHLERYGQKFQVVSAENEIRRLSAEDRKSTRLNSSHSSISYAVFCLKKKIPNVSAINITTEPPMQTALSRPAISGFAISIRGGITDIRICVLFSPNPPTSQPTSRTAG